MMIMMTRTIIMITIMIIIIIIMADNLSKIYIVCTAPV